MSSENQEYLPDHFLKGMLHIGMVCDEPKKVAQFYIDNFGFTPFYDRIRPDLELYFIQGPNMQIEILSRGNEPHGGPIDHMCFEVMNIDAFVEELKAKGVKFETETAIRRENMFVRGYKFIYCRGLADERIELFEFM